VGGAIGAGTDIVVWGMINCEFASVWPFHGAGGKTVVSRMSPPRYSFDGDGHRRCEIGELPNSIGRNCHRPPGRNEL
jgi:hypothetical protein